MKLSKRLLAIASLVPQGCFCADIGADHGYLITYLAKNKLIEKGYASDNKKGPYLRLLETVKENSLSDVIECSLKNGLTSLPTYINTCIIAGMGGDLISSIIEEGKEHLDHISTFILSPHGLEESVRRKMDQLGYKLVNETVVFDEHYYEVLVFEKGHLKMDELDFKYGYFLRREKSEIFILKYKDEIKKYSFILTNPLSKEKVNEIDRKIKELNEIIA